MRFAATRYALILLPILMRTSIFPVGAAVPVVNDHRRLMLFMVGFLRALQVQLVACLIQYII